MKMTAASAAVAIVCLTAAPGVMRAQAQGPRAAGSPTIPTDDYYAAANRINIEGPIAGDVVIAGRVIRVAGPVRGDILAAGWSVTIADHAMDDVRAAGGDLMVDAPIEGDLTLCGGDVTLGPETHVSGRTWLFGGTVRTDGRFEREVHIAAANVQLAGEIREPLHVVAEELHILPGARVLAPLTYEGPTPLDLSEAATVSGPITYRQIPAAEARRARWPKSASSMLFAAHLFLAGLLLIVLLPRVTTAAPETLRTRPWQSLLTGLALLVTLPVVAFILLISVLGIPIGVSLAALYLVGLLLGILTTAFYVGNIQARLLHRTISTTAHRAMFLAAGVATLAILRSFPVVGGLIVFLSIVFGLGALTLWLYRAYAGPTAEPLPSGT